MYTLYQEAVGSIGSTIVETLIILLIGLMITHLLARIIESILKGIELNKVLSTLLKTKIPAEQGVRIATVYLGTFITILFVLIQLGIASTILIILASAIILLVFLSLLFSVKDIIPNAISGIIIQKRKMVEKGMVIEVKGVVGTVIESSLLETRIETKKKEILHIPNSVLVRMEVKVIKKAKKT